MTGRRGWLRLVAGTAVGALFIVLLARRVDWPTLRELLAGVRPLPLALGIAALALGMWARIARWWWMLRTFDSELPLARCVRPFLASLALNNTLPLRAGDVVRVVGFRGTLRAPAGRIFGTLLVERLLDLLVLLVIFFAALLGAARVFPRVFLIAAGSAGATALALLAFLVASPGSLAGIAGWRRWPARLVPMLNQLTQSLTLLRSPGRALGLLGLSLVAWIIEGAVFVAAAWSLGVALPPLAAWLSLGAATLATLLPSAPGYVGTFDWFATLGLTAYGVDPSAAAATALLAHLLIWLPVTAAGFAALGVRRSGPVAVSANPGPA